MEKAKNRRPANRPAASPDGAKPAAVQRAEKALRPSQCRTYLRKTVAAAYKDIVQGFVDQAKGGACQHLKMATEVVETQRRVRVQRPKKGPAELLLEKYGGEFGDLPNDRT